MGLYMYENLIESNAKIMKQMQEAAIHGLAVLAEYRDPETGGHIQRVQNFVYLIAQYLYENPIKGYEITEREVELMANSAPLHDIGKVGISDSILLKPGKLTPEEFEEMKKHSNYGADAIEKIQFSLGDEKNFLNIAREIVKHHHERWDGNGYPDKLKGTEIPLAARIMAIADVYDALVSKRPYKEPFSQEKAISIIKEGSGTQFDSTLVEIFEKLADDFKNIEDMWEMIGLQKQL